MILRHECIPLNGVETSFRILHVSDVHFRQPENQQQITEICHMAESCRPAVIAVTGDLVSRNATEQAFLQAVSLLDSLHAVAPVLYSLGNHEKDLPETVLSDMLSAFRSAGILVLDNTSVQLQQVTFTGLTLPQTVYKNPQGTYFHLEHITQDMLISCIGNCTAHPHVLLAHCPMGLPAYAQWGADLVLSGHVHGGIIRMPVLGGMLSPERKFFPRYTKGIYPSGNCIMHVSAGIGKFRLHNPAELVCLDILPVNAHHHTKEGDYDFLSA